MPSDSERMTRTSLAPWATKSGVVILSTRVIGERADMSAAWAGSSGSPTYVNQLFVRCGRLNGGRSRKKLARSAIPTMSTAAAKRSGVAVTPTSVA